MAFSFKKAGEAIAAIGIVGTGGLVAVIRLVVGVSVCGVKGLAK